MSKWKTVSTILLVASDVICKVIKKTAKKKSKKPTTEKKYEDPCMPLNLNDRNEY